MARDSEEDILTAIQRQINDFSTFTSEADQLTKPALKANLLPRLLERCEAEAKQLDDEVTELEGLQTIWAASREDQIRALNDVEATVLTSEEESSAAAADITKLEEEIELLASLTNVTFTKTVCTVTDVDKDFIRKHHEVAGFCHNLKFVVKFTVEETWEEEEEEEEPSPVLTEAEVYVADKKIQEKLTPHIQRLANYGSLTLMFRLLMSMAEWQKQKDELLDRLVNDHQGIAEVEEGVLVVKPPAVKGCEWRFEFDVTFAANFMASSQVKLKVKAPTDLVDEDKDGVLSKAVDMFEEMKKSLGASAAIDTLIKTLS